MKLRVLNLLLALPFLVFAQAPTLQLKTGEYLLPEGIQLEAFQKVSNGKSYGLLQVHSIPSYQEKNQLSALGIKLLDYLPELVYQVELSTQVPVQALTQLSFVRSLMPFPDEYKLAADLAVGNFPTHALLSPELIRVNLILYKGIDQQTVERELDFRGFRDYLYHAPTQTVELVWHTDQLLKLAQLPFVSHVAAVEPSPVPENLVGKTLHRSNALSGKYPGARNYDGAGVFVGMNDDGTIGPHIDYQGRIDQTYVSGNGGNHGDHVAGTIVGGGNLNPIAEGMAPGALLYVYNVWDAIDFIDTYYYNPGIRITSTSYGNGCNAGYTAYARTADQDVRELPALMHVFSAGNSGSSNCGYGAGAGWGNITGGIKAGKNVIATGNVTHRDALASSSSRGPSTDGRIKPDICAVGTQVLSTIDVNTYANFTGTSMAAPGISGIMAQLYQAYKEKNNGNDPDGGLIKGLMLNTAEDLGNVGPDYRFGWGRVNALRAVKEIENNNIVIDSVANAAAKAHSITVSANVKELRVMVYWTDYEGAAGASKALVNDLDISLSDGTTTYLPWLLDPTPNATNLNTPATTGVDNLNNMEQVSISEPAAGNYTLTVNGTNVPFGPQKYYLFVTEIFDDITVTYPMGGESFVPNITETIRWDAILDGTSFTFEYSTDGGTTWSTPVSIASNRLYYDWNVPNSVSDDVLVRISKGSISDVSDAPFVIAPVPNGLQLVYACPDSMKFSWSNASGISAYEIDFLGNKDMDSVASSTVNEVTVYGINPYVENWVAIRSLLPNGAKGRRSIALNIPQGLVNCQITEDLSLTDILSPSSGNFGSCTNNNTATVSLQAENKGIDTLSGISFSYQLNGGSVVTESFAGSVPPGTIIQFNFATPAALVSPGQNTVKVWLNHTGDANAYNDTLDVLHTVYSPSGPLFGVPFNQSFDSWSTCGTSNDCGSTVCIAQDGWLNLSSTQFDGNDFRTNNGTTPSTGTGPSQDNTSGTGNYLYTEASGSCSNIEAILMSPCIDLSAVQLPELSFYFHKTGTNQGDLEVDIVSNGKVTENIWTHSGSNSGWELATVDLAQFAGDTIQVVFRGRTGPSWSSDIALDDVKIEENITIPTADFSVQNSFTCINSTVFVNNLSDASTNWKWSVTPSGNHSFVNGTNDTTQHVQLQFSTTGVYDVQLVAINPFGSDTIVKTASITITKGLNVPMINNLESATPLMNYEILNPDLARTWEIINGVTGANGGTTTALRMQNRGYNASGEEDVLEFPIIDLTSSNAPYLSFDVAYAPYSTSLYDELRIDISTDCGASWTSSSYHKANTVLATANATTASFSPASATEWRSDTLDLTAYAGSSIKIRLVAINGFGNNLYVDNIQIAQPTHITSSIQYTGALCENDAITFFDSTGTDISYYQWDFGAGATPSTANGPGPHSVSYASFGNKFVTLLAGDSLDTALVTNTLFIEPDPVSNFTVNQSAPGTIDLNNLSMHGQAYQWTFGDGNISNDLNPNHTYSSNGTYTVTLIVTNLCGSDSYSEQVIINNVGMSEELEKMKVYPNPMQDALRISGEISCKYRLLDMAGNLLLQGEKPSGDFTLDVSQLPAAVYQLQLEDDSAVKNLKLIKIQ